MKQPNEERLTIRLPKELVEAIKESAAASGWGVPDQVRYELLRIRGMWKEPKVLPKGEERTMTYLPEHVMA